MPGTKASPKRPTAAEIKAGRVQRAIEAVRAARAAGAYPLTVADLAARLGEPAADLLALIKGKVGPSDQLLLLAKEAEAPLALKEDAELLLESPATLEFAAARARAKRAAKQKAIRGSISALVMDAGLAKEFKAPLSKAIEQRLVDGSLPAEVRALLPLSADEIAERLVAVLGSQRRAGAGTYPVPSVRLLELAECDPKAKETKAALKQPAFATQALACMPAAGAKDPDYILRSDLAEWAVRLAARGVETAVRQANATTVFSATELAAVAIKDKPAQRQFAGAFEHAVGRQPNEFAWLRSKGKRMYFRREDVEPADAKDRVNLRPAEPTAGKGDAIGGPAPTADFAAQFDAAFAEIDGRTGGRNFVKVLELRKALSHFSREEFDRQLRVLRLADRYTMDSAHGGAVQLTAEERQAGIQEGSSLLVYVSRK